MLEALPRSLRSAVQEAQPLTVDGNVITFGVSKPQIDNVKPRFQKEAHEIREKFIEQLGAPPRFKFAVHSWTGNGPGAAQRGPAGGAAVEVEEAPPVADDEPGPDEPHIDLVDPHDVLDAPATRASDGRFDLPPRGRVRCHRRRGTPPDVGACRGEAEAACTPT